MKEFAENAMRPSVIIPFIGGIVLCFISFFASPEWVMASFCANPLSFTAWCVSMCAIGFAIGEFTLRMNRNDQVSIQEEASVRAARRIREEERAEAEAAEKAAKEAAERQAQANHEAWLEQLEVFNKIDWGSHD